MLKVKAVLEVHNNNNNSYVPLKIKVEHEVMCKRSDGKQGTLKSVMGQIAEGKRVL